MAQSLFPAQLFLPFHHHTFYRCTALVTGPSVRGAAWLITARQIITQTFCSDKV